MTAPALIQASPIAISGSNVANIVLSGVTPGSTLAVLVGQTNSATRTYSVTDNLNGAWTTAVYHAVGRNAGIFYVTDSEGGDVTITINAGSTATFHCIAIEMSPAALDVTGANNDNSSVNSHHCAGAGGVNTAANVLLFSGGIVIGSGGTLTANGSATLLSQNAILLGQYRRSDTAISNERSTWTSATARPDVCVSAAFVDTADTTPPTLSSATVASNGTTLTCVFSEPVVGVGFGISLDDGSSSITATYVSGSGTNTLVFTLGRAIEQGETVTLDHVPSGIEDLAGNALGAISDAAVTNNSTYVVDTTPPQCINAELNGDQLVVTFNENITGNTGFTVESSTPSLSISSAVASGATVTLTLSRTPESNESLRVVYAPGNVQDTAANAAAGFSRLVVNNNSSASTTGQFFGIKSGGSL